MYRLMLIYFQTVTNKDLQDCAKELECHKYKKIITKIGYFMLKVHLKKINQFKGLGRKFKVTHAYKNWGVTR